MKKRSFILIIALILALCSLFVSCGEATPPAGTDDVTTAGSPDTTSQDTTAEESTAEVTTAEINPNPVDFGNEFEGETRLAALVPRVDGATFSFFYNPGDNCDEVVYTKATADIFKAYIAKLWTAGYRRVAENELGLSSFATWRNDKYTVNVQFFGTAKEIRVIAEPYTANSVWRLTPQNEKTDVTTAKITMLGLAYIRSSDGKYENTGASIVIRLVDGSFIVIDGGHKRSACMEQIIKTIRSQAAEYASDSDIVKIAAWFISHPHGDHWGALTEYFGQLKPKKIQVESIVYNFMSSEEYQKSKAKASDFGFTLDKLVSVAKTLKAKTIITHAGERYYFAGLTVDSLATIESIAPYVPEDENHLSLVLKFNFTDPKTGTETTFVSNNDASGRVLDYVARNFGKYLVCDLMQIAHHGAGSKGMDSGVIKAYKTMKPATVLWTSGMGAYTAYRLEARNYPALNTNDNPNYKEVYVADKEGMYTEFDLPYTVGSAKTGNVK